MDVPNDSSNGDTPVDTSQFAVVIDALTMRGKTVTLGFKTEEDYIKWQEYNKKARNFIDRVKRGGFGNL